MLNKSKGKTMIKRTMWWNLPIEEVEELSRENKLTSMTCVEYDDEEKEEMKANLIKKIKEDK
jgi:hypothetical protein